MTDNEHNLTEASDSLGRLENEHAAAEQLRLVEAKRQYRQKLQFSLSLGNAAGLVAVLAAISNDKSPLQWWLLLPSAWAFALGSVAAGGMLVTASLNAHAGASLHRLRLATPAMKDALATIRAKNANQAADTTKLPDPDPAGLASGIKTRQFRYGFSSFLFECASAAAFCAGLFAPLIVLTRRAFGL